MLIQVLDYPTEALWRDTQIRGDMIILDNLIDTRIHLYKHHIPFTGGLHHAVKEPFLGSEQRLLQPLTIKFFDFGDSTT